MELIAFHAALATLEIAVVTVEMCIRDSGSGHAGVCDPALHVVEVGGALIGSGLNDLAAIDVYHFVEPFCCVIHVSASSFLYAVTVSYTHLDRAVGSNLIKGAASAFIFGVGDRSRVRPLVVHIVQFYGFTGNMRCV